MIPRPDMAPPKAPEGVEVALLTSEEVPSSHVYMEAQIFAPDSRRFVLHRSAHAHGSDPADPEHRYLLCDLDDAGALSPLTEERGATAPSVSPDGEWLHYFVDETRPEGGRLTLKRVRLDGSSRETLHVLDTPPPRCAFPIVEPYPLSTISSDGKRLAISARRVAHGESPVRLSVLLVYDLEAGSVDVALAGVTWWNMHPQYCRSRDAEASRDIMVQQNHGAVFAPDGRVERLAGGAGADIHAIRDDGTDFRAFPWGRDGDERCQGHQCWRGRSRSAITSTTLKSRPVAELIESEAVPDTGHTGLATPGGRRNVLSREFDAPFFCHFATDIDGRRLITDHRTLEGQVEIIAADLPREKGAPLRGYRKLALAGPVPAKEHHVHPFLSPDGRLGFFNSAESGTLQAYMVRLP